MSDKGFVFRYSTPDIKSTGRFQLIITISGNFNRILSRQAVEMKEYYRMGGMNEKLNYTSKVVADTIRWVIPFNWNATVTKPLTVRITDPVV